MDLVSWGHSVLPSWKLEASCGSNSSRSWGWEGGSWSWLSAAFLLPSTGAASGELNWKYLCLLTAKECINIEKYANTDYPQNMWLCGARGLWVSDIRRETLEETPSTSRETCHLQMIIIIQTTEVGFLSCCKWKRVFNTPSFLTQM